MYPFQRYIVTAKFFSLHPLHVRVQSFIYVFTPLEFVLYSILYCTVHVYSTDRCVVILVSHQCTSSVNFTFTFTFEQLTGLMDFLLSDHPVAKTLTDHIVFMIVPMLNPDGVVLGNYRYRTSRTSTVQVLYFTLYSVNCKVQLDTLSAYTPSKYSYTRSLEFFSTIHTRVSHCCRSSLLGYDLNRHWQEPAPWCHPTIYAIKNFILNLIRDQVLVLALASPTVHAQCSRSTLQSSTCTR